MEALAHKYKTEWWHLFINSSKISMKGALLLTKNKFLTLSVVHVANMKEMYVVMKLLLDKIN